MMTQLKRSPLPFFVLALSTFVVYIGFREHRVLGGLLLLSIIGLLSAWWRHEAKRQRAIRQLSTQLRRVLSGDYHLDIRDYEEGELAVLSADIYKLVTAFREQSSALMANRTWLADSISDISHQLKTPITSLMMLTDLLKKDLSPERRREFIYQLGSQTDRLQWLVKNLLTLSKLDANAVAYYPEPIRADDLIRLAAQPLLIGMELKNQTLEVIGQLEYTLIVDGDWLAEAVTNILKNAHEHGPADSIIQVEVRDLPMAFTIAIHNRGVIPATDLPHIFTRFYRGSGAGKDSIGIGLAIARAIVTQQGGQIDVETTPDSTGFIIRFPK